MLASKGLCILSILLAIVHYLFLCLEFSSLVVLSLSLFRISIRMNITKILLISAVMAGISYYVRDIMEQFDYSVLIVLMSDVTLFVILFSFPLLYASLICITGYLAAAVVQIIIAVVTFAIGLSEPGLLETSFAHYTAIQMLTAITLCVISWWLHRKKLGFMFMLRRFRGKQVTNPINYVLTAILLLAIVVIQLGVLSFHISSVHIYLIFSMLSLLSIALFVSYRHNKKLLQEKYTRMTHTYDNHRENSSSSDTTNPEKL
jgi:hypothetical protein